MFFDCAVCEFVLFGATILNFEFIRIFVKILIL